MKFKNIINCEVIFYPFYCRLSGQEKSFFVDLICKLAKACNYPHMRLNKEINENSETIVEIDNSFLNTKFCIKIDLINDPLNLEKFTNNSINSRGNSLCIFLLDAQVIDKSKLFTIIETYITMAKLNKSLFYLCLFNTGNDKDFEIKDFWWSNLMSLFFGNKTIHNRNWRNRFSSLQKIMFSHNYKTKNEIYSVLELSTYDKICQKSIPMIFNFNKNFYYE